MITNASPSLPYPCKPVSPRLTPSPTLVAFNALGEGPRDTLDPSMKR